MKAYITKYALTRGIIEVEGFISGNGFFHSRPTMIYNKGDYHANIEDALHKAEQMRDRKIKSLEKQIEILKAKTF